MSLWSELGAELRDLQREIAEARYAILAKNVPIEQHELLDMLGRLAASLERMVEAFAEANRK